MAAEHCQTTIHGRPVVNAQFEGFVLQVVPVSMFACSVPSHDSLDCWLAHMVSSMRKLP
jgi:hypothetical protein